MNELIEILNLIKRKHPKSYWKEKENCRKFLESAATELNVNSPSDWGKVPTRKVQKLGGTTLLKQYKFSLFACLKDVYTGWYCMHFILRYYLE